MKKNPMIKALAAVLTLLLVCTTVLAVPTTVDAATKANKITLSAKKKTLYVGKSFTLKAKKVKPAKVTFASSDSNVVTVNKKGKVTAKSVGKATITVTSKSNKKAKATCKITVKQPVKEIQTANKLILQKGKKATLKWGVTPNDAASKKLKFTSKNKKVATVNKKGVIKAKKAGSTKIIVKSADGCAKATVKVTVKKKVTAVKSVALDQATLALTTGAKATLKATVAPAKATAKNVYWVSADTSVAKVSKNGEITAVGAGTVKVTAYASDASGKSATCTVTVTAPATDATTPTQPTNPTDATTPTQPTNPADPTTSTDPTAPTDPTVPTAPVEDNIIVSKDGVTTVAVAIDKDYTAKLSFNDKVIGKEITAEQMAEQVAKFQKFAEMETVTEAWDAITEENVAAYAGVADADVAIVTEGNKKTVTVTRADKVETAVVEMAEDAITVTANDKTVVVDDIDMTAKTAKITANGYTVNAAWTATSATIAKGEATIGFNIVDGNYVTTIDEAFASEAYGKVLDNAGSYELPETYEELLGCLVITETK